MTASVISFFLIPHYPYFRYFIGHPSLTRTVPKTGQKNTSPRDNLYLMCPACFQCARDPQASQSLPLSAAIDLREIHLARQPSLQVPVGHIVVPGGIKVCSPGTPIFITGTCRVHSGGLLLWRPVELALLPEFAFNVEQVVPAE